MYSTVNYSELERLVSAEEYDKAEDFCLQVLNTGVESMFWQTQLGYIYFLNEQDIDGYYEKAPSIFQSLVTKYPDNINAHFWLGYIYSVVLNDLDKSILEFKKVLLLNPNHPYTNLVLAGYPDYENSEKQKFLSKALKQQPTNLRVLNEMSNLLFAVNQKPDAKKFLENILNYEGYVERDYGIMNQYINDVLTCATHQQNIRQEAKLKLAQ
ncbi:hypothetical protein Cylst_1969 [Cylindrospermum stagnale PCC 7417]|uniref:Uncharacterized protein n=1 Tax=Cylindrospermum stagnale PCC 7417 TaxID=56107 RepID=K9WV05_9NOST|nr:hypothetical protein [Cylindrospermum stagnale]AFZ24215.1 hypothetical protein Cylst_1969 [Cylindrospermum stagnale PCC 7417]